MMAIPICNHEWGPPRLARAEGGPLEGDWIVEECLRCKTIGLQSAAGDGFDVERIIAQLAALGCDPRPVEERE
jgi:hypothetical protein